MRRWGGSYGEGGSHPSTDEHGAQEQPDEDLKPHFCATVRALRAICVCAEDYCRAQEATPEATPTPPASAAM